MLKLKTLSDRIEFVALTLHASLNIFYYFSVYLNLRYLLLVTACRLDLATSGSKSIDLPSIVEFCRLFVASFIFRIISQAAIEFNTTPLTYPTTLWA